MTRLLFFLAAYFAGALGTNYGGYGAGESAAGPGSKYNGQMGDGSAGAQKLDMNAGEGKDATIKISINIIAKGQGGGAPIQYIGEPAMSPGKTHQVCSGSYLGSCCTCLPNRFQVTVGGSAGLVFTPDSLAAEPGDMVQFNFLSKNHTITQSAFAKPCVKLVDGADSGFMPNGDETLNPPPTFKFQVLDKKPTCTLVFEKGLIMDFS